VEDSFNLITKYPSERETILEGYSACDGDCPTSLENGMVAEINWTFGLTFAFTILFCLCDSLF